MKNKIDTVKLTSRHPVFPICCYNIILLELFRGGEDTTEKLGHLEIGNTSVHLLMPDLWCCRGTLRGRDPPGAGCRGLGSPWRLLHSCKQFAHSSAADTRKGGQRDVVEEEALPEGVLILKLKRKDNHLWDCADFEGVLHEEWPK